MARGTYVDTTNRVTVAQHYRQWMDSRVLRPGTVKVHESILRNHIEPTTLGSRPIVRVRPSEIQEWARSRASLLAPETVHVYVGVLRSMFATAVLDGVIAANPVQPVKRMSLPKTDRPKFVPLTVAQVQAWADHAEPRVASMMLTQAGLGLRVSELRALRVVDVDFLRLTVHITGQLDRNGRRAPLKTASSRRDVPLPSVTAEVLAEHIRAFPPGPSGLIFSPAPARKERTVTEPGAWNIVWLDKRYRAAAKAAGLPEGTASHDLRHHYASVLLAAGESVHAVAERLGNGPEKVLNVYGHLMPDREDTTRRAVDAAWAVSSDVPGRAEQK